MAPNYIKFTLTRASLKALPELAVLAEREGAVSASLIVHLESLEKLMLVQDVGLCPGTEYFAIKAPTLEGTEIWIVSSESQPAFEKAAGFEISSIPLTVILAETLVGQWVRHPLLDSEARISVSSLVRSSVGTGIDLIPSRDAPLSTASEIRDSASFLKQLYNDGMLISV